MKRRPGLVESHLADGFASDDECPPKPIRKGYGDLPGDKPAKTLVGGAAAVAYHIRQASSGPSSHKPRFIDALLARPAGQRPSPAQTAPRTAYQKHCDLMSLVKAGAPLPASLSGRTTYKTDVQLLRESHRFLRTNADEDGSWEATLARKYYDRLFKEYVICDLAGYRKGNVGFRWRTEAEVVQGRGQFHCGHKVCRSKMGLRSYEVDFKYRETGVGKRALVKVRLCEKCAYKLHYRRFKKEKKRKRLEAKLGLSSDKKAKSETDCKSEAKSTLGDASCISSDSEDDAGAAARRSSGDGAASAADAATSQKEDDPAPTEDELRKLEALAWKGPDPEARTREDDFDDYFGDLFL
eukprot:TRINITY_DN114830_c0_g1_i1.p1 TRINITY_DN114830_c0_g1~~TRINITY_DN114830_c0_g1_i1.p1  ORF type:complete len:353 (-),score=84.46 TRINITY_DN114830_c0_g1_i1:86-1144(-)